MTSPSPQNTPLRTKSIRFPLKLRLTILYGAAFFAAGALLLAVNYAFVRYNLEQQRPTLVLPEGIHLSQNDLEEIAERSSSYQRELHKKTLDELLKQSLIALGGVGAAALILGYIVTERALAPLQEITASARSVAQGTFPRRLNFGGPNDEIKELADTFDTMVMRLQASFDAQKRFVAHASHELRTPLALNRTVLEVALADPAVSEDLQQTGKKLLEINARNERLIHGLLLLARSENELTESEPLELDEIIEGAVEVTLPEFEEREIQLRTTLDAPVIVDGSAVLLDHLVTNLLYNAARHNIDHGDAEITLRREGSEAVLCVENTGRIIPPEEIGRLFEPFQSLNGERTQRSKKSGGSGLGLSIVAAITHTHSGRVDAMPREGGGLRVCVRLPIVIA